MGSALFTTRELLYQVQEVGGDPYHGVLYGAHMRMTLFRWKDMGGSGEKTWEGVVKKHGSEFMR